MRQSQYVKAEGERGQDTWVGIQHCGGGLGWVGSFLTEVYTVLVGC